MQEKDFEGLYIGLYSRSKFWDLILNSLLRELGELGVYVQAFVDDVVLMFSGQSASSIEEENNRALARTMVLTKKLKYDDPVVHMNGEQISQVGEIRLLGLTIDRKLTFIPHVTKTCKKAVNIYKGLARAAKAMWGLSPTVVRIIYITVIEPIVLYASCAWALATRKLGVRKMLDAVQRSVAFKACRAHRTMSLHSALILSRIFVADHRQPRRAFWACRLAEAVSSDSRFRIQRLSVWAPPIVIMGLVISKLLLCRVGCVIGCGRPLAVYITVRGPARRASCSVETIRGSDDLYAASVHLPCPACWVRVLDDPPVMSAPGKRPRESPGELLPSSRPRMEMERSEALADLDVKRSLRGATQEDLVERIHDAIKAIFEVVMSPGSKLNRSDTNSVASHGRDILAVVTALNLRLAEAKLATANAKLEAVRAVAASRALRSLRLSRAGLEGEESWPRGRDCADNLSRSYEKHKEGGTTDAAWRNLSGDPSDEAVMTGLFEQNLCVKHPEWSLERLTKNCRVAFKKSRRESATTTVVLECEPELRDVLVSLDREYIGREAVMVCDYSRTP
ncbi:Putative 115 kDa protein in type-1 retrotransposable element R1DM [Eumeta japonica]|uniref:115 kDa protein in type-1 retrotransposable element R1DM n=1 Tax=Eumeta variegata TaxID=151549 RepID=A0A4C1Z5I8_EUMVA|nr:Putative 115 kDa protein in type-1 retrotransposable element R1DM [Eumeta japonica]